MVSAEERHDGEEPAQKQYDRSVDHARVRGGHGRSEAVKASMSPRRPSPAAACTVRGASDGLRCNRHWRCKHPAGARRHASLRAHADKVRLLLMKPSRQFPNRRTGKGAETSAGLTLTCVCCYHTPAAQPGLRTSRRSSDRRPPDRDRTERYNREDRDPLRLSLAWLWCWCLCLQPYSVLRLLPAGWDPRTTGRVSSLPRDVLPTSLAAGVRVELTLSHYSRRARNHSRRLHSPRICF
jgi:hypothetical protein